MAIIRIDYATPVPFVPFVPFVLFVPLINTPSANISRNNID